MKELFSIHYFSEWTYFIAWAVLFSLAISRSFYNKFRYKKFFDLFALFVYSVLYVYIANLLYWTSWNNSIFWGMQNLRLTNPYEYLHLYIERGSQYVFYFLVLVLLSKTVLDLLKKKFEIKKALVGIFLIQYCIFWASAIIPHFSYKMLGTYERVQQTSNTSPSRLFYIEIIVVSIRTTLDGLEFLINPIVTSLPINSDFQDFRSVLEALLFWYPYWLHLWITDIT